MGIPYLKKIRNKKKLHTLSRFLMIYILWTLTVFFNSNIFMESVEKINFSIMLFNMKEKRNQVNKEKV
jgi:predicted membrane protein